MGPVVGFLVAVIVVALSVVLAYGVDIGPAGGPHQ
jgi:hypothetical protein